MAVRGIKNNFEETVLKAKGPVIMISGRHGAVIADAFPPAIERMSEEHGETVKMVKLDIDEEPELAEKYDIDTIPSPLLFRDGELVSSVVNPGSQDAVEDWLRENGAFIGL